MVMCDGPTSAGRDHHGQNGFEHALFCSFPNLFQEFKISHKIIEFFVTNVPSVNIIVSNVIVKSAI